MNTTTITTGLVERAQGQCELCSTEAELSAAIVPPKVGDKDEDLIAVCRSCIEASSDPSGKADYWRCLTDTIWSQVPAVQVMCYRLLSAMPEQMWGQDLVSMMYMDDATTEWAEAVAAKATIHKDSNGHVLAAGDTVVLIKDLQVKGAGFTAKRGTAVRRISLVRDQPDQIEGRVNDQHIVILTQYVKKT